MPGPLRLGGPSMSSSAPFQDPSLERLQPLLARIEPRARAVSSGLSAERFRARPPDGGWSVGEVFEHLCRSDDSYLEKVLPEAIAKARTRPAPSKPFKSSLLGGLMISALKEGSRRRLPTTRTLDVQGEIRDGVVEVFLEGVRKLESQMRQADGHDLRVSFRSPIAPVIRLQLGDAFAILIEHAHRHLAQAERAREAIGG